MDRSALRDLKHELLKMERRAGERNIEARRRFNAIAREWLETVSVRGGGGAIVKDMLASAQRLANLSKRHSRVGKSLPSGEMCVTNSEGKELPASWLRRRGKTHACSREFVENLHAVRNAHAKVQSDEDLRRVETAVRALETGKPVDEKIIEAKPDGDGTLPFSLALLWPEGMTDDAKVYVTCKIPDAAKAEKLIAGQLDESERVEIEVEGHCMKVQAKFIRDVASSYNTARANQDVSNLRMQKWCTEEKAYNEAFANRDPQSAASQDAQLRSHCAVCDALCAWLPLDNLLAQSAGVKSMHRMLRAERAEKMRGGGGEEEDGDADEFFEASEEDGSECQCLESSPCNATNLSGSDPYCYVKGEDEEGRKKDCAIATKGALGSWRLCFPESSAQNLALQAQKIESLLEKERVLRIVGKIEKAVAKACEAPNTLYCSSLQGEDADLALTLLNLGFFPMPYAMRQNLSSTLRWLKSKLAHLFETPRYCKEAHGSSTGDSLVSKGGRRALGQQARAAAQCGRGRGRLSQRLRGGRGASGRDDRGTGAHVGHGAETRAFSANHRDAVRPSEISQATRAIAALGDAEDCDLRVDVGARREANRGRHRQEGRRGGVQALHGQVAGGELSQVHRILGHGPNFQRRREKRLPRIAIAIRFSLRSAYPLCGKM